MSHGNTDGNDQIFINNSYATWDVGDVKNAIINTEYIRAGADVYVFVTDKVYTYTMYFYDYPYGSISEAEVVKTIECTYKLSDIVNYDGKECIKLDVDNINNYLDKYKLWDEDSIIMVYASDFYDGASFDCSGYFESRICRY